MARKEQGNIEEVAASALSNAMISAALTRAGEWPVYGNESGLELMRTLADLRTQVAELNIAILKDRRTVLKDR